MSSVQTGKCSINQAWDQDRAWGRFQGIAPDRVLGTVNISSGGTAGAAVEVKLDFAAAN